MSYFKSEGKEKEEVNNSWKRVKIAQQKLTNPQGNRPSLVMLGTSKKGAPKKVK